MRNLKDHSTIGGNSPKKFADESQSQPSTVVPPYDIDMATKFAMILDRGDGCLELRVIGNKNSATFADRATLVGFFDDPEGLAKAAKPYHGKRAIYVGLNPRQRELLAIQAPNRLFPAQQGSGGKAANILYRQIFAIDIDAKKPDPRLASSKEELEEAQKVFERIVTFLSSRNIFPITGDSGNGKHILIPTTQYPIGEIDSKGALDEFALLLRWFDRNFSTEQAAVDVGVFDPARVWKLYGTTSVKGANTPERPWRKATFELPASPQLFVDIRADFKNEIHEQKTLERSQAPKKEPGSRHQSNIEDRGHHILSAIRERGLWLSDAGQGKHFLKCPWEAEHTSGSTGDGSTAFFDGTTKGPGFTCLHSHCSHRTLGDLLKFLGIERPRNQSTGTQRRTRPLELHSLAELYNRPDEKVPYLVEDMLRMGGVSVMAAKPKVGKTTLVRYLSLCVARGMPFLGRPTAQGPVIVLAMEEILDEMKRHYIEMGADGSEPIYVHAAGTPDQLLEVLEKEITRIRPTLVVLDTLFRAITVEDGNSYAVMTAALEPFQDLARRTGVHLLLVHHLGKSDREGADGILGSTAIFGAVDGAVILNKKPEGMRTLKTESRYGKNIEETELKFDEDTRTFSLAGTVKESASERIQERLLEYLRHAGPDLTAAQIEDNGGMRKQSWRFAMRQLLKAGKVISNGEGKRNDPLRYSINPSFEALYGGDRTEEG